MPDGRDAFSAAAVCVSEKGHRQKALFAFWKKPESFVNASPGQSPAPAS